MSDESFVSMTTLDYNALVATAARVRELEALVEQLRDTIRGLEQQRDDALLDSAPGDLAGSDAAPSRRCTDGVVAPLAGAEAVPETLIPVGRGWLDRAAAVPDPEEPRDEPA